MRWSDIPFKPAPRILRQFAAAWLVFWLAWAAQQWFARGHARTALALAALAVVVGGLGLIVPAAIRWLYIGSIVVVFPIGWVVSHLVLGLLYYGMITPVALFFRWRGRDPLHRKSPGEQSTFWTPKTQPEDVRRYFRQY